MRIIPTQSTNLAGVAYDPEGKDLIVQFHHGGYYLYEEVPPATVTELLFAESQGKYFIKHIKNVFPCRKVEEEAVDVHV